MGEELNFFSKSRNTALKVLLQDLTRVKVQQYL